ncbi:MULTISPECIES: AvrPphF family type III effector [Erwinia]|uniref:AvrPphF family type III effector n=1 Tax=Erwinia papayae TaxID=206499 RepID=A0ABV3N5G4_9GAMM|nr:AvrPphF family type III effector [Erwinia mallotivora]
MGHAGGQAVTSIYQLSEQSRNEFLSHHDPMSKFDLDSETPLYRTTDKKFVKNGKMAGNPNSGAWIEQHEELTSNHFLQGYDLSADDSRAYLPKQIRASDLPHPSLNVMTGPEAREAIGKYTRNGHVAVQMRLGDFLERGGKAYTDVTAAASNGDTATALIVTLPEGKKVPVRVLGD